jgi:hypothetical protein
LKAAELKIEHKVDTWKTKLKKQFSSDGFKKIGSKVKGVYKKWRSNSTKLVDGFVHQFDP